MSNSLNQDGPSKLRSNQLLQIGFPPLVQHSEGKVRSASSPEGPPAMPGLETNRTPSAMPGVETNSTPSAIPGVEPNRTPSAVKQRQSSLFAARMRKLMEEEEMTFKMKEHDGSGLSGSGYRRKLDFDHEQAEQLMLTPSHTPSHAPTMTQTVHSTPLHHLEGPDTVKERVWYLNTSQDELKGTYTHFISNHAHYII